MSSSDDNEDPYKVLGVPKNATTTQIKSAYRKLALKHHPDKQKGGEEDKAKAATIFTKIGNAYEILSDEEARRRYDASVNSGANRSSGGFHHESPFESDFFADDPFFGRARGGGRRSRSNFTDPFELFEQVFGEEFGMGGFGRPSRSQRRGQMRSPFDDPFFSDPMAGFGHSSPFGMMDQMMGRMQRSSRGFHSDSAFGGMDDMIGQMHEQMSSGRMGGGHSSSFSYSSSSGSSMGHGGSRSVSTTTRIINGKRQTVTETTVVKPDGTVERHVETTGDEGFPQRSISGGEQGVRYLGDRPSEGSSRSRRSSKRSSSSRF